MSSWNWSLHVSKGNHWGSRGKNNSLETKIEAPSYHSHERETQRKHMNRVTGIVPWRNHTLGDSKMEVYVEYDLSPGPIPRLFPQGSGGPGTFPFPKTTTKFAIVPETTFTKWLKDVPVKSPHYPSSCHPPHTKNKPHSLPRPRILRVRFRRTGSLRQPVVTGYLKRCYYLYKI